MALVITHIWTDKNQLVYSIVNSATLFGGTAFIPSAGGATPDLVTDGANNTFGEANGAALRRAVRSGLDGGNGTPAAGAWTQAQARALLLLNGLTNIGGINTARCQCSTMQVAGLMRVAIDASVDGSGRPRIDVIVDAVAGEVNLYVQLVHSLTK
jgi:hypothetical protein